MIAAPLDKAALYTDFEGISALRREAQQAPDKALEGAARQFEALFMQMMLKSMRDANLGGGLFDNDQSQLYQDMYDKQLANHVSGQGKGLGLAEMLVRQLQGTLPQGTAVSGEGQELNVPRRTMPAFELQETSASGAPVAGASEPTFDSPEAFVERLWPEAQRAARRLGVAPEALLAQAALETGWGRAVIRHPDGHSSHNLFNIKADSRWDGEQVGKLTLEYEGGVARKERAQFRSYGSYADSFDDYVQFLQENSRYRGALAQAGDPVAFLNGLQRAGYATDPAYAEKVTDIMRREVFTGTVAALKDSAEPPLT